MFKPWSSIHADFQRRKQLQAELASIPDGDAPEFSAAWRRWSQRSAPVRAAIAELSERIGQRPKFWKPRPEDAAMRRIRKQYSDVTATGAL